MADTPREPWPGTEGALALLDALFPPEAKGFIETRCLRHGDVRRQDFARVDDKRDVYGVFTPPADWEVFVGVAPRCRKEGAQDAVEESWVVWGDLDFAGAANALAQFELEPALVVASGTRGHLHAYWPLSDPVGPEAVEAVNRALAERLGADKAAVDAGRLMRLPGTFNFKQDPPVRARLVRASDRRFALAELEEALGHADDDRREHPSEQEAPGPSEPVQGVLERLREVKQTGNGWQALCPAHDDHRPSLGVAEGDDGRCLLHCFKDCTTEDVVAALGLEMHDLFADDQRGSSKSVAAELVAIAQRHGAELFHDSRHQAFASIPVAEHHEVVAIGSSGFRRWLRRHFHQEQGRVANSQAVADAVDLLCAMAEFDGPEVEVAVRITPYADGVLVDLGDDEWRVVRVGPNRVEVLAEAPVPFIRGAATKALPEPVSGGSLDELREFLNLPDEAAWRLLLVYLVAALIGQGPFAILILQGEKGSGKSVMARVIRLLVDPAKPALRGGSPDDRELLIAAQTSYVVAFDNLSGLTVRLSDSLCRLSTGAGFGTRRLYTDDEEVVFDAMRPVLLNGIADIASRPDLLSRAIVLELPVLDEETTEPESDFDERFDEARPRIFGALLDLAAKVIARLPEVELERSPRMADFARVGVAVEQALGWPEGSFLAAYRGQQADAYEAALDAEPIGAVLLKFMQQPPQLEGWNGTATELLGKLTQLADDDVTHRRNWPASASVLGKRLKELLPALRPAGLEIEKAGSGRGKSKQRGLWIFWAARDGDAGDGGDG